MSDLNKTTGGVVNNYAIKPDQVSNVYDVLTGETAYGNIGLAKFSYLNSGGTHGAGGSTEYTTGVTITGTPGQAGAKLVIEVTSSTATPLYYYCPNHSGMGGSATLTSQIVGAVKVFGEVMLRTKSSDILTKVNVGHIGVSGSTTAKDFTVGGTVTGRTNNYTGTISVIYSDLTDTTGEAWSNDGGAQNVDFEIDADGFIDFSESNPFGDPSETY